MTELSFLIELLLNHKLSVKTKQVVQERIKYVEANAVAQPVNAVKARGVVVEPISIQQPSPIATQAMMERQLAIQAAVSGKPVEVATGNGSKGPRKF